MRIDVYHHHERDPELFGLLHQVLKQGEKIMSKIAEFSAKQTEFNDRIDKAVDDITSDVALLNSKIIELQNSAGAVTPEDQAFLDALQARGQAIADKLDALDALTPPTPPTQ